MSLAHVSHIQPFGSHKTRSLCLLVNVLRGFDSVSHRMVEPTVVRSPLTLVGRVLRSTHTHRISQSFFPAIFAPEHAASNPCDDLANPLVWPD